MGKITINQDSLKTSREYKRHKVADGSNVFRILPPFGDVETHNNYAFKRWAVAWLINPDTGKRTPFSSPLTLKGEKECPVNEYAAAVKERIEDVKGKLKAKGLSNDKIKEKLKGLYDAQWNIRVAYSYAYNACDKSGNVGILELKSTAHQAVKQSMKEYITDFQQDPTSLNSDLKEDAGVWFNIKRDGEGKMTKYSATLNSRKVKDKETGEVSARIDRSPLPEGVVEGYDDLGYDLFSLYRQKSYDELKQILLYNISLIAEDHPEVVLPGFEGAMDFIKGSSIVEEVEEEYEEEVAVAPTPKVKKTVALQMDEDEDLIDVAPAAKKKAAGQEDLLSYADSILED